MDLQELKTEITTDPAGIGYDGKTDAECFELMSAGGRAVDRTTITAGDLMSALVEDDYSALTERWKSYFDLLVLAGEVKLTATVKSQLRTMFSGKPTKDNLVAEFQQDGSRAQELGFGRVTPSQIAKARKLP